MSTQNFYRNLLSGLKSSYIQSQNAANQRSLIEGKQARDQQTAEIYQQLDANRQRIASEREQQKQAQAFADYQKEGTKVNALLSGQINGHTLTDEQLNRIYSSLDKGGLDRLAKIKNIQRSGNRYITAGQNVYEVKNGVLNPEPIIKTGPRKAVSTRYGLNPDTGTYGWATLYNDKTTSYTPAPVNPYYKGKGPPKKITDYDPAKLRKALTPYLKDRDKILTLQRKYATINTDYHKIKPGIREENNAIASNNEQTLYNLIPEETRQYIDRYYNLMKSYAAKQGITLEKLLGKDQGKLKGDFMGKMKALVDAKVISKVEYRLLSLWAKFRFGFIYGEKKNATKS